eukprot:g4041.t1
MRQRSSFKASLEKLDLSGASVDDATETPRENTRRNRCGAITGGDAMATAFVLLALCTLLWWSNLLPFVSEAPKVDKLMRKVGPRGHAKTRKSLNKRTMHGHFHKARKYQLEKRIRELEAIVAREAAEKKETENDLMKQDLDIEIEERAKSKDPNQGNENDDNKTVMEILQKEAEIMEGDELSAQEEKRRERQFGVGIHGKDIALKRERKSGNAKNMNRSKMLQLERLRMIEIKLKSAREVAAKFESSSDVKAENVIKELEEAKKALLLEIEKGR